ncbi:Imm42 family immunity protein [Flavobacterium sp. J27]|uniref:Imm42 family immunity protein n=1 Tax=Flavobacterium sp. J27 TaxID=2060419 RepID=UPI00102F47ED|nr:Imm42 family immunity protein [Flavobacterium sp. J27]
MTKQKVEKYLGDKKKFAIRFLPIKNDSEFAFCHLVLNGEIIGDQNESCYLNTWKNSLKEIKEKIVNSSKKLFHKEFENRSDREIFELIWKANQCEQDFNPKYNYLPVLENEIWSNCNIGIDETTDAYLITMIENKGLIKFIWEGWRVPCPVDKIGKLNSVSIEKKIVIETLDHCIVEIEKKKQ